jgi:hypothetical protein
MRNGGAVAAAVTALGISSLGAAGISDVVGAEGGAIFGPLAGSGAGGTPADADAPM